LGKELSFYTIVPDDFKVGSLETNVTSYRYSNPSWNASHYVDVQSNQLPVIVDTGTTMTFLPQNIIQAYVNQIPGRKTKQDGSYWAECDAKLPKFGVTIGGKTFYLAEEDLMFQEVQGRVPLGSGRFLNFCQLGIADMLPMGPFILGTTFLNSVVSVFDVGADEMRFYSRK
jgi:hypothetical protein